MGKQLILDKATTLQKIRRIAYEIHENNYLEQEIVLVGTMDNGFVLAEMIVEELKLIANFKIELVKVFLDKLSPTQSEIKLSIDSELLKGKTIILVDDVLNSGRTMAYSLKPFLNIEIKKIQTAVLVDRDNKNFPISANYNGFSLSTTLQEVVTVVLKGDDFGIYLS